MVHRPEFESGAYRLKGGYSTVELAVHIDNKKMVPRPRLERGLTNLEGWGFIQLSYRGIYSEIPPPRIERGFQV
jgi:hypothetical protein